MLVYRDVSSTDVIIRVHVEDELKPNGRLVESIQKEVVQFLVKEYIEKYGQNILSAIHADEVAYRLTDDIKDYLKQKLFKENQNEPS